MATTIVNKSLETEASRDVERDSLAVQALYEITLISTHLRGHIARVDRSGEIQYVARGMLDRIQTLSETLSEYVEPTGEFDVSLPAMFKSIECRYQTDAEVSHG